MLAHAHVEVAVKGGRGLYKKIYRDVPEVKSRGTARTPLPQARRLHLSAWKKSQPATGPVWAQNPDSQPSKVFPSPN